MAITEQNRGAHSYPGSRDLETEVGGQKVRRSVQRAPYNTEMEEEDL